MKSFKPPHLPIFDGSPVIFLAGTIDNGASVNWQEAVTAQLSDLDVTILNPRREAWDASWEQRIDFAPFREQVEWEMDGLDRADWILIHFASGSKSPISLLELGLHAAGGKVVISCAPDFWRRGNVEVVATRFGIPLFEELGEVTRYLHNQL